MAPKAHAFERRARGARQQYSADLHVVILAAGKGTRMRSGLPKVLHRVAGVPMIDYVLASARSLQPATTVVVIGHQSNDLKLGLAPHSDLTLVVQEPQLGTGHALLATEKTFAGRKGTLLLLSGDVPLLKEETLRRLLETHRRARAAATIVTAVVEDPHGYGRIVRSGGRIARIVEERDATAAQRKINEINSGIYALELEGLFDAVRGIGSRNDQREYYLPDLVSIYRSRGLGLATLAVADPREVLGINTRAELAVVANIVRTNKNAELMTAGVTLVDPATTYVERDVWVGADTILHPGVSLEGRTVIGKGCEIQSGARIVSSTLADHVTVLNHCVIMDSAIGTGASIGPFAHLRGHAQIGGDAKIGNFVEVKKSSLGPGSKASHLAYLGDAVIGERVNIGAGTITCNYDGDRKHTTTIADGAFIGSDTQLIAPVTVGEGAYVGTGSTIREDVPPGALAVSAGKQRNIEGWVDKRRAKGTQQGQ
jgi:bifunctional UDP-N-acetylglucosamine pyrophosphorylase/glucosamine-1-phosphate N-acetyltransferase